MSQRGYRRRRQATGLVGQLQQVILHPVAFFKTLPETATSESRTWLWAALLILAIIGTAAVQQDKTLVDTAVTASTTAVLASEDSTLQADLVTGLSAASLMVVAWVGQAILMIPIALLAGKRPQFNLKVQIAIWASVPLALIALVRIILFAIGLESGYQGISGIFLRNPELWGWETTTAPMQLFILNIASHISIFGLWNLILLYYGVKYCIVDNLWLCLLFIVMWVLSVFLIPTILDILLFANSSTLDAANF